MVGRQTTADSMDSCYLHDSESIAHQNIHVHISTELGRFICALYVLMIIDALNTLSFAMNKN